MLKDDFTPQDLVEIGKKIKATHEDTTPFLVVADDKLNVMGDANKTEEKKGTYTIKYRYPKEFIPKPPANAKEVGDFIVFAIDYPNITITPRRDLKILSEIFKLKPFIETLHEDGTMTEKTDAEMFDLVANSGKDMLLALYNLVATFLDIDDISGEYMLPGSVVSAMAQIIDTHPEIFNEADAFFG